MYFSNPTDAQSSPTQVNLSLGRKNWGIRSHSIDDLGNGKSLLIVKGSACSNCRTEEITLDSYIIDQKTLKATRAQTLTEDRSINRGGNSEWFPIPKTGMYFSMIERNLKVYQVDADGQSTQVKLPGIGPNSTVFEAYTVEKGAMTQLHVATSTGVKVFNFPRL